MAPAWGKGWGPSPGVGHLRTRGGPEQTPLWGGRSFTSARAFSLEAVGNVFLELRLIPSAGAPSTGAAPSPYRPAS
jgi:hypothetical protein